MLLCNYQLIESAKETVPKDTIKTCIQKLFQIVSRCNSYITIDCESAMVNTSQEVCHPYSPFAQLLFVRFRFSLRADRLCVIVYFVKLSRRDRKPKQKTEGGNPSVFWFGFLSRLKGLRGCLFSNVVPESPLFSFCFLFWFSVPADGDYVPLCLVTLAPASEMTPIWRENSAP